MNGSTNLLISEFFVLLVIHFLVHFFIILKSQKKQTILKYGLGLVGPLLVFFHSIYALYLSIQSHVFFTKTLVLGDAEVLGSPRFVVEFHPLSALILLIFSLLMALFFWEGFRKRIELNLKNQSIGLLAMIGFTVVVYSGSLWTSVAGLGVVVLSEFLSELPSSGLSHRYASFGFVQKWIGLMLLIISGIVFENFGASLVFSAEDSWYLSPALEFASYSFLFGFGLLIGCFPFWSLFFTEKDRSFISQWIHTVIQTTSLLILFGAITPLLSRVIDLNWIHFVIFSQAVLLFLFGFFQKDPKRKMVCQSYIGLYLFYELSLNLPLNYTIPFVCISILVYSFRYFHLFYGGEILNKKNLW
ncbi:MAG: hypothetical protein CL678_09895, partial [Bdellovibrionaceae bacterium]|nr:hypothetical protein [Pseudobdellovibrionaceae bacterium]